MIKLSSLLFLLALILVPVFFIILQRKLATKGVFDSETIDQMLPKQKYNLHSLPPD
jgi:hypothetical protein